MKMMKISCWVMYKRKSKEQEEISLWENIVVTVEVS